MRAFQRERDRHDQRHHYGGERGHLGEQQLADLQTTTVTGAAANITINAAISAENGTLVISSNGSAIAQGAAGKISVANLTLSGATPPPPR